MPMQNTLDTLEEILVEGMTTEQESEDWYIKRWYINDPLELDYRELPIGVIKPTNEGNLDQYVQEDTEVNDVTIYLYPSPINRAKYSNVPSSEAISMVSRVRRLIRRDPTLDRTVVDAQVLSSIFRQPGFTENGGAIYNSEVRVQIRRRDLWNAS